MISVLYTIILITNFKLIEMCIKSSPMGEGSGEGLVGFVSLVSLGWLIGVVVLFISPPTPSANVLSHHDTALPVGSRGLLLPAS